MSIDKSTFKAKRVLCLTITADFQLVSKMAYGNGEVDQHRLLERFFFFMESFFKKEFILKILVFQGVLGEKKENKN